MYECRLDKDLRYGLEVECGADMHDLEDYQTVKASIQNILEDLRDCPIRYSPYSPTPSLCQ